MFHQQGEDIFQVVSFGSGEPAFLGIGGWIGPWRVWQHVFETISGDRRCIAYDHRGSGMTKASLEGLSFEDHVDDVFRIMDIMKLERCWLGGESNGGAVAAAAAIREPSRFHGLAIIASSPMIDPEDERTMGFARHLEADHGKTLSRFVDACIPEPNCQHLRPWLVALLSEPDSAAGPKLIRSMKADLTRELGALSVPALVIHGALDAIQPLQNGRAFADAIPGAGFAEIPDAGHVPTITRPDRVAKLLRDFMQGST